MVSTVSADILAPSETGTYAGQNLGPIYYELALNELTRLCLVICVRV